MGGERDDENIHVKILNGHIYFKKHYLGCLTYTGTTYVVGLATYIHLGNLFKVGRQPEIRRMHQFVGNVITENGYNFVIFF